MFFTAVLAPGNAAKVKKYPEIITNARSGADVLGGVAAATDAEGQVWKIENGTALIAMRAKAPIYPIYIDRKLSFFRLTRLYVGEPIPCDDLLQEGINAESCGKMNERMRETFRRMIRDTETQTKKQKNF